MAVILRLLSVFAVMVALFAGTAEPARAADGDTTTIGWPTEVLVPLGPVIYYIVPGPQPTSWVPVSSKVALMIPGDVPENATVTWYRNGVLLRDAIGTLLSLGVVQSDAAAYFSASVAAPGGRISNHGIQLEVFDPRAGSRLENCSLRAAITPALPRVIGGIVVGPQRGYAVLVRAVGPALENFSVTNALPDPELHFFDADGNSADGHILGVTVAVVGAPTIEEQIEAATKAVGAFPLPPGGRDVAYLVAFPPGAFTAHVTSPSGATGEVLLEFYDVPMAPVAGVP